MDDERVFNLVLATESSERDALLDEACKGDAELRARVERLLIEHDREQSFLLDACPAGLGATIVRPVTEGPGAVIGPYKLLQQIGEGGMGVVFMAEQTAPIQRVVALKIIKPGMDTRQVISRFEAERQALAVMDHPNIAKVLDAGTTATGKPYFVMELVKGVPITRYCDDKQLPLQGRLDLFIKVCLAVQHAHQKGIIHRDIKPTNVLVAEYDNHAVPKVIDFGVAKATAQRLTEQTMFTEFGQVLGTMEYMSPEQAKLNQLDIDTRSDIYSLGVLLYELLAGSTPFEGKRLKEAAFDEMLRIIREEEPPKPSTRLSTTNKLASIAASRGSEPKKLSGLIAGELDWVAMKALEKDRNRRFETASAFAADIQRYLDDEPVQACPPSASYRFRKFVRRNKAALIASTTAIVILLMMVAGLAVSNLLISAERNETAKALKQKEQALSEKVQALALAQAQRERSDANFVKAIVAVRDVITKTALGEDGIPPALRRKFSDHATNFYESLIQDETADPSLQYDAAVGYRTIGMLHGSWQEFDQADQSFHRAIDILQRLSTDYPRVDQYPKQLAYALYEFSLMLKRTNQTAKVPAVAERGIVTCERVLAEMPEAADALLLCNLAQFYADAIAAQRRAGDSEAVDKSSRRVLEILQGIGQKALFSKFYVLNDRAMIGHRQRIVAFEFRALGRHDVAEKLLRQAIRTFESLKEEDPSKGDHWHFVADTHREVGRALVDRNKPEEAEQEFRDAIEVHEQLMAKHPDKKGSDSERAAAYFDLARLLINSERREEAAQLVVNGVKAEALDNGRPPRLKAQIRLGHLLLEAGDKDAALTAFSEVLAASPDLTDVWMARGWLYDSRGEWANSEADFTRVIALEPERWEGWSGRAFSHFHRQQWDPAIADFSKAVDLAPEVHMNVFHRGRVYIDLGHWAEAAADFSRAIEIDPNHFWGHYHRAQVYVQTNRPEEAIADLRQAIAKGFNDSQLLTGDSKLEPLRSSSEFQKLVAGLEKVRQ